MIYRQILIVSLMRRFALVSTNVHNQEVVSIHSNLMVKGILSLLTVCPHEVAHLRKELLIGARHILTTELRSKFVPFMEKLFDEDILLGKGWTTHESLRPLAYSTLADLVHHVRQSLPLSDLERAVALFRYVYKSH